MKIKLHPHLWLEVVPDAEHQEMLLNDQIPGSHLRVCRILIFELPEALHQYSRITRHKWFQHWLEDQVWAIPF